MTNGYATEVSRGENLEDVRRTGELQRFVTAYPGRVLIAADSAGRREALIEQIAAGDRAALGALVHRYWAPMFRYAERTSRNASTAEDALQDTFLAVWRGASGYRGQGDVGA